MMPVPVFVHHVAGVPVGQQVGIPMLSLGRLPRPRSDPNGRLVRYVVGLVFGMGGHRTTVAVAPEQT